MSGIELWKEQGYGFWDIAGAAGWDLLAAFVAMAWILFVGMLAVQSLWIDRECGWKEKGKVVFFTLSLLFPLLRLIWLACEIWLWK